MQYSFLVRKRAPNNYQLVISYKGKDGKWHQKAKGGYEKARLASSDTEIARLLETIKGKIAVTPDNENLKFADFLKMYVQDKKLRHTTEILYSSLLYFFPSLSEYPMQKVTAAMIKQDLALNDGELSSKNTRISQIKSIFKSAYEEYEVIPENPMQKLRYYKEGAHEPKKRVLMPEEIDQLIADGAAKRPPFHIVVAIGAFAGLRISETFGLSVGDIDFDKKAIHVRRQFYNRYIESTPLKTKNSKRTVPIPPRLLNLLHDHIERMENYTDSTRIIRNVMKSSFNRWMKIQIGQTSHALRHTYITNLVAAGLDVKTVAALAGDTPQTILINYVHYTDQMREKAGKDVARIFG